MIHSKPKTGTLLSVSLFIVAVFAVDAWIILTLLQNPGDLFLIKLILAAVLLVIAAIVFAKSFLAAVILKLGENKLHYRHLLGAQKSFNIKEVASWKEEIVKRKKTEFRSLQLVLTNGKKLQISNHENSQYPQVINYLNKKVRKQRL